MNTQVKILLVAAIGASMIPAGQPGPAADPVPVAYTVPAQDTDGPGGDGGGTDGGGDFLISLWRFLAGGAGSTQVTGPVSPEASSEDLSDRPFEGFLSWIGGRR